MDVHAMVSYQSVIDYKAKKISIILIFRSITTMFKDYELLTEK